MARRAQSYFGELVKELRHTRKDALQATKERDAIRVTLHEEQGLLKAAANAVKLLTSEKQSYLETLEKARQANCALEDRLATTTSTQDGLVRALTAATTRQAELEGELAEMPRIQAEVAAAQAQILKDAELLSKAEADLAELLNQKKDLDACLLESQQEVTSRAKQEKQMGRRQAQSDELLADLKAELQQAAETRRSAEVQLAKVQGKLDVATLALQESEKIAATRAEPRVPPAGSGETAGSPTIAELQREVTDLTLQYEEAVEEAERYCERSQKLESQVKGLVEDRDQYREKLRLLREEFDAALPPE